MKRVEDYDNMKKITDISSITIASHPSSISFH